MKIEIDTRHDSPEEIKKVIKMLQHLVGEPTYSNNPNIFEDPVSFGAASSNKETGNAFVNMFGDSADNKSKEETMDAQEEEKGDIPQVIPY